MNATDPFAEAYEYHPGEPPPHEKADGLPSGFRLRDDGVHIRRDGKDGASEWKWLCSPIRVLALPRDRASEDWGRYVEIIDPDDRAHRWAIPAGMFAGSGDEMRREAFRLGLRLSTAPWARPAFSDLLQQWQPKARALTTDRLGWADETCTAFVLGDGRVLGAEGVVFQHENAPLAAAEMKEAGTVESWRDTVAAKCIDNPLLILCVSLAFTGVLLEPLGLDGGGLHLRGSSSRGKSTAQRAAVSVWGGPGFLHTWRATANGLEGVAAACNGTVLALDEMGEVSGREAGQAAYMLANGVGKHRADRTGRARAAIRWRTCILSSGEIGLADKLAEAGAKAQAGQAVRLLDIAADTRAHGAFDELHGERDGAAFADAMKRATATSYGAAGPAFVQAFLDDRETCSVAVRDLIERFREAAFTRFPIGAEGQTERAVARVGAIAAAGELATDFGITGWPAGAALEAGLVALELWLEGRGGGGPAEARESLERTRAFIVAHGASRFEAIEDENRERLVISRAGWRDDAHFLVAVDAWREIHAGANPQRAARHVAAAGFLTTGDGKNLTTKAPRSVEGRPRVYAVKVEILGSGDD